MDQGKKRRGENWSSEEKEILRQLITQSSQILENKGTNSMANILKAKEWKNVMNKFNELTGKSRSCEEVKLAWKRMKLAAKARISSHRQQQMRTGGGEKPQSPSEEDLSIMAIVPQEFTVEINDYDSDAIRKVHSQTNEETVERPSGSIVFPEKITVSEEIVLTEQPEPQKKKLENTQEPVTTKIDKKKLKENNKTPLKISEITAQAIAESNIQFKKKQIGMLEEEHKYNIKIAQLKIKKMELEIALLENKKMSSTNE